MKSSGSNCLIATDVYVPTHRILSMTGAIYGAYGRERTDVPLYRCALFPVLTLALARPTARAGSQSPLQLVKEQAAHKPVSYTYYTAQSDSVAFQLQIAKAAMLIDTAHLHAHRAARTSTLQRSVASTPTSCAAPGSARTPGGSLTTSPRRSTS